MSAVCVLSLTSCGQPREASTDKIKIGVLVYDEGDTFLKGMIDEMISETKDMRDADGNKVNVAITVGDASGDQSRQNDQMSDMIANGCDVLAINLVDRTDPTAIINLAKKNNVPIVFFNRELVKHDLDRWNRLYYVGAPAENSGIMQGEEIADYFRNNPDADKNGDGKIQYVILKGEQNHQDTIIRSDKVISTLESRGFEMDRLAGEVANWSRAQAQNRMQQLINEYGDKIELVICNNDDMALGVIDDYKKKGTHITKYPAIFGVDGTEEAVKEVQAGTMKGTVYNNAIEQASKIMDISVALARGENVSRVTGTTDHSIYVNYEKITRDNVSDYLSK